MDENACLVVVIVCVAADMIAAVAYQDAFIVFTGKAFGNDTPRIACSDDKIVKH
jgi:hypothetical protein